MKIEGLLILEIVKSHKHPTIQELNRLKREINKNNIKNILIILENIGFGSIRKEIPMINKMRILLFLESKDLKGSLLKDLLKEVIGSVVLKVMNKMIDPVDLTHLKEEFQTIFLNEDQ